MSFQLDMRISVPFILGLGQAVLFGCSGPVEALSPDTLTEPAASDGTESASAELHSRRRRPRPTRCEMGGSGSLLECSNACPSSLFRTIAVEKDFAGDAPYAPDFMPSFVAPTTTTEGLQFGPHPANANWWDTYSPISTQRTDLSDVLLCVRFRMRAGAIAGANTFQVSIRGGSEGMVLAYNNSAQRLSLSTKTSAADTWREHAAATVPLTPGEHEVEFALYGQGSDFAAEMKDVGTSAVVGLRASYGLPPSGPAALLGWQLGELLVVSRVVIGTPLRDSASRLLRNSR